MLDMDYYRKGSTLPAKRRWKPVAGIFVMPATDPLPDPAWPNIKVNLEIAQHAVVYRKKVVMFTAAKPTAIEYATKLATITGDRVQEVGYDRTGSA
jgi:hypothetical protein